MVLYRFENKEPTIGDNTFVNKTSEVIGNVIIGRQCYIGPGAIIRGDYGAILIGDKTSVEENCVLHARPLGTCNVGNMVTVGHGSILHNCTVSDYAVIGMGAIVSDYAAVGEWAVIGEGCVVKNGRSLRVGKSPSEYRLGLSVMFQRITGENGLTIRNCMQGWH